MMTHDKDKDEEGIMRLGAERWRDLTDKERGEFLMRTEDYGLHNIQAEQAILGAIMSHNNAYWPCVKHGLTPEIFYNGLHQMTFEIIQETIENGGIANPVTLKNKVDQDILESHESPSHYLASLALASAPVVHLEGYVDIIKDLHVRRRLMKMYEKAIQELRHPNEMGQLHKVVTQTFGQSMDEVEGIEGGMKITTMDQVTVNVIEGFKEDLPCIPTGITVLDKQLRGGFFAKKSYCIAAKPKAGKTTMLGTLFKNITDSGRKAMFIAGEMGEEEIHCRSMARELQRNSIQFYTHRNDDAFVNDVMEYYNNNHGKHGFYCDVANITFDQLKQAFLIGSQKHGVEVFFLDYLGLVEGAGPREMDSQFQHRVTKWIAQACKRYGVTCVYAAQLNREGHIRGSDGAVMNADAVFHLHKEEGKAWMDCLAMRYAPMSNVGSQEHPALIEIKKGPYFKDIAEHESEQQGYAEPMEDWEYGF